MNNQISYLNWIIVNFYSIDEETDIIDLDLNSTPQETIWLKKLWYFSKAAIIMRHST